MEADITQGNPLKKNSKVELLQKEEKQNSKKQNSS